ncbi:MAG: class I SAM-dependent methyltransferase [Pseudomonadota bacterium]
MHEPIKTEDGIPIGNVYDKYATQNPIARALMQGFERNVLALIRKADARDIHEIGCGEGHLSQMIHRLAPERLRASDFSAQMVATAQETLSATNAEVAQRNVYELTDADAAELIVCCEVLEHVDEPRRALEKLRAAAQSYVVLSVPREPIWRVLNMARGKYWSALGNTPGHLQHWSSRRFVALVGEYFDVCEVRKPLPWTMLLARRKAGHR